MDLNEINYLKFTINEHIYSADDIYINLGIGAGYGIKKIWNCDTQKEIEINTACASIFLNYVKKMVSESYGFRVDGKLSKNIIHISMKTSARDVDNDMQKLLDIIYRLSIEKSQFEKALEMTRKDFIMKSEDVVFRIKHKMMEFSDLNKGFVFNEYIEALDKVTYDNFLYFIENLVTFRNSYLFINGDIKTLKDCMFFNDINNEIGRTNEVKIVFEERDIFLLMDQHLIWKNYDNYKIGCIRFDFLNQEFSITNKFVLLSIIASSLFKNKAELSVDGLDTSILYYDQELAEYKDRVLECINQEKLLQIKDGILNKYSELLDKEPKKFGQVYVEMRMQGSDLEEYLNMIGQVDEKSIKDLYHMGDIKITEGHSIYTK